jgi:DNA-binding transcriptional MerR regulator
LNSKLTSPPAQGIVAAMEDSRETVPRHPIRVVSRRTGLTPAVLRAWERRYDVVHPSRSEGGQRLYSDLDVRRLALIAQALEAGRSIRHVAPLSLEELERLVDEDAVSRPAVVAGRAREPGATDPASILATCMQAIETLNTTQLDSQLLRAAVLLTPEVLLDQVILPLLQRVGLLWEHGVVGPATEHAASVSVRRFLDWLRDTTEVSSEAPILVCATPSGHRHEFGALIAAAVGALHGWRSSFLGPDLPPEEIAAATRQLGADAVAVSAVFPVDDPTLGPQIARLVTLVPEGVPVYVGGPATRAWANDLVREGAVVLSDLSDLRRQLDDRGPDGTPGTSSAG